VSVRRFANSYHTDVGEGVDNEFIIKTAAGMGRVHFERDFFVQPSRGDTGPTGFCERGF